MRTRTHESMSFASENYMFQQTHVHYKFLAAKLRQSKSILVPAYVLQLICNQALAIVKSIDFTKGI